MARLFEDFVQQFYKKELPNYKVSRENIYWDTEGDDLFYLSLMQTDISLENDHQKVIIDTKYYQHTLQQNYNEQCQAPFTKEISIKIMQK